MQELSWYFFTLLQSLKGEISMELEGKSCIPDLLYLGGSLHGLCPWVPEFRHRLWGWASRVRAPSGGHRKKLRPNRNLLLGRGMARLVSHVVLDVERRPHPSSSSSSKSHVAIKAQQLRQNVQRRA